MNELGDLATPSAVGDSGWILEGLCRFSLESCWRWVGAPLVERWWKVNRLSAGAVVLGDSLGAFRDGVLGQFSREQQTNSGLDLAGADGVLLVVANQFGGFPSNALKDVLDEVVHDGHSLLGDSSVRVNLLEDFEDVGGVGVSASLLLALLLSFLVSLLGLTGGSSSGTFASHVVG